TCLFHLEMNGAAVNSGMGTCGLCGPIGVWTGWMEPSAAALAAGAQALTPGAADWTGLLLVCFVLPAILCPLIAIPLRRKGWIRPGDLTI
ncbi:MAG: PTS sugar transporter subunit IIC, partial [Bacteroidales bacterium]|nr:PTS sugar transporter subunit IIC [Bacteroidales bacterium]